MAYVINSFFNDPTHNTRFQSEELDRRWIRDELKRGAIEIRVRETDINGNNRNSTKPRTSLGSVHQDNSPSYDDYVAWLRERELLDERIKRLRSLQDAAFDKWIAEVSKYQ